MNDSLCRIAYNEAVVVVAIANYVVVQMFFGGDVQNHRLSMFDQRSRIDFAPLGSETGLSGCLIEA